MNADLPVVSIATFGLGVRQREALLLLMKQQGGSSLTLSDTVGRADVWLIDEDQVGVALEVETTAAECGMRPAIRLSAYADACLERPGCIHLRKPYRVDDLFGAIRKVQAMRLRPAAIRASEGMAELRDDATIAPDGKEGSTLALSRELGGSLQPHYCGTAADVDLDRPELCKHIYFDQTQYLCFHLARAFARSKELGRVVVLRSPWPALRVCAATARVGFGSEVDPRRLRSIAGMAIPGVGVGTSLLSTDQATDVDWMDYEGALWRASLCAAKGRVPVGTTFDVPITLKRWPNFTRLDVTPGALEIAALWIRKSSSIRQAARILDVPQRYVFSFYTGVCALGLVGGELPNRNSSFVSPEIAPEERGFLRRLLARMRG